MFKHTAKQIIDTQWNLMLQCFDEITTGSWPPENVSKIEWKRHEWMTDEDYQKHVDDMNQHAKDALRYWPLDEIDFDDSKFLIKLVEKHEYLEYNPWNFLPDDTFVFMGEILQMPRHIVVMNLRTNQIHACLHDFNFVMIPPSYA